MRTLKPACILVEDRSHVAMLRDLSEFGAGFETSEPVKVGQVLAYRWGDHSFRSGKVIWQDGARFGVENCVERNALETLSPYRSVRIPLSAPFSAYVDGQRIEGEVINLSQKGLCALLARKLKQGALATIRIQNRYLENTTVKWMNGDRIGFALANGLSLTQMNTFMDGH